MRVWTRFCTLFSGKARNFDLLRDGGDGEALPGISGGPLGGLTDYSSCRASLIDR